MCQRVVLFLILCVCEYMMGEGVLCYGKHVRVRQLCGFSFLQLYVGSGHQSEVVRLTGQVS